MTTQQIEVADGFADSMYGDRIDDVEISDLGIVYTLITGEAVVISPDGMVSEQDMTDPDGDLVVVGQIPDFCEIEEVVGGTR